MKLPLTFPSLGTVHCEVSRLICLQSTSLHAWPKHFDLLGMATLSNVDLGDMEKLKSSLPPPGRRKTLLVNIVRDSPFGQSRALCLGALHLSRPPRRTGPSQESGLAIRQAWSPDLPKDWAFPHQGQGSAHNLPGRGCVGCSHLPRPQQWCA